MLKQVVTNKEHRSIGSDTYERKVASSYELLRNNTQDDQGFAGFSADTLHRLVDICDSKSPHKETEFVLVALANCTGSSCKL